MKCLFHLKTVLELWNSGTNSLSRRLSIARIVGFIFVQNEGVILMKLASLALGLVAAGAVTAASAEPPVNLTGTYRCIVACRDGMIGAPAFVTQNGDSVNLTTETGESFHAWPDWNAPNSRIWIEAKDESAVYSPDGMRIQFDDGRVWQRALPPVAIGHAPVVYYGR